MTISSSLTRSLFFAILIMILLAGCGGSSAEVIASEPDSEVKETAPSGEAGTATIRVERQGQATNVDWHWEISNGTPPLRSPVSVFPNSPVVVHLNMRKWI